MVSITELEPNDVDYVDRFLPLSRLSGASTCFGTALSLQPVRESRELLVAGDVDELQVV